MIFISHRGNLDGPQPENENKPDYVESALKNYNVEIDVFFYKSEFWLGHDKPEYKINKLNWLQNNKLWVHAKNLEALNQLLQYPSIHSFWHQNDDVTLTSRGYMWTYPNKKLFNKSIAVINKKNNKEDLPKCSGICSDYIKSYYSK